MEISENCLNKFDLISKFWSITLIGEGVQRSPWSFQRKEQRKSTADHKIDGGKYRLMIIITFRKKQLMISTYRRFCWCYKAGKWKRESKNEEVGGAEQELGNTTHS